MHRWYRMLARRTPPPLPYDLGHATFAQLRRYLAARRRMLRRRSRSRALPPAERAAARAEAETIRGVLAAHPLLDDLRRCVHATRERPGSPDP